MYEVTTHLVPILSAFLAEEMTPGQGRVFACLMVATDEGDFI